MKDLQGIAAQTAWKKADAMLASKGRTFYWARFLLPARPARRATRLYGICRYLDDVVDEAVSSEAAQAALEEVTQALDNKSSQDPSLAEALAFFDECQIDPEVVRALLASLSSDLLSVRIPDERSLHRYCYGVAGTVGLMMCRVLDVTDKAALRYAIDLGIAMQLTNICRDVAEDALAGRRYLPATLVGELSPDQLHDPSPEIRERLRQTIRYLLEQADLYYQSGELGLSYLPLQARLGIAVAARVYRSIGGRLRQQNYEYWKGRARVSGMLKAGLTVAALGRVFQRSFWLPPRHHDRWLHRHLEQLPYTEAHNERI